MAYSIDFREKAIKFWDNGHTKEELYEVFEIYPSRITAWKKLLKETGSLEPQYKVTRESKINLKKLEKAVERKPDATLAELAKIFNVTEPAIFYALERANLTLKKRLSHTQNKTRQK
jgi:transposase